MGVLVGAGTAPAGCVATGEAPGEALAFAGLIGGVPLSGCVPL